MNTTADTGKIDLVFVVAVSENGVIGREGDMPWQLSTDLKRFKALTMGRPVVMGRKTFRSIGKPLPGRENIVITRDRDFAADGVHVAASVDAAIALASGFARRDGMAEVAVIGGGEIYRQLMDRADILHVTHVEAVLEGDTRFPDIDPDIWESGAEERIPEGPRDTYPTRFVSYRRRSQP